MSIPIDYKALNHGINDLSLVGETVNVTLRNDLGQFIPISFGTSVDDAAKSTRIQVPCVNNGGTSGLKKEGVDSIFIGIDKFRWNSGLVHLDIAIDGKGIGASKTYAVETVTATLTKNFTTLEVGQVGNIISVNYDLAGFDNLYLCEINFKTQEGDEVPWTYAGGPALAVGAKTVELDAASSTGNLTDVEVDIAGIIDPTSIDITTRLLTKVTGFDANVNSLDTVTIVTELENSPCVYTVGNKISPTDSLQCRLHSGNADDFPALKASLDISTSGVTKLVNGSFSFINSQVPSDTYLGRSAEEFDLTLETQTMNIKLGQVAKGWQGQTMNVYYTTEDIGARVDNNPLYDMISAWNYLGEVSAQGEYEIDSVPKSVIWVGVCWKRDAENDFGPYLTDDIDGDVNIIDMFRCP